MTYEDNEILTLKEVAFALGGRRIGYRWRFRWGTVLEYFSNADVETRQRKLLDGESHRERQADSLQNVPGREKHGPEWRAAKEWEEEQKRLAREGMTIPTALELLMAWGDSYLTHVQRTMSRQTYVEKKLVTKDFFAYCGKKGIHDIAEITSARAYEFLSRIKDERGANVANKYRKNLLAAWNWGSDFFEGFPQVAPPFLKVKPFPVRHGERYVPPESDVIKVFQQAEGQDLVMLLTLYFTGGRRSEIFRLTWSDVDLQKEKIRLTDNKSGNGTGALAPNAPGTGQGAQVVAGCPSLQGGQCVHAASERHVSGAAVHPAHSLHGASLPEGPCEALRFSCHPA